jgi:predicted site-specific integrase-resolvase
MPPKLLNETAAAELLGIAPATLRRWRVKGAGPAYIKVGRAVRYNPDVLEQYISCNVMTSTSAKLEA